MEYAIRKHGNHVLVRLLPMACSIKRETLQFLIEIEYQNNKFVIEHGANTVHD